jgi:hypothetical protein
MATFTKMHLAVAVAAALTLGAGTALAQHEHHDQAPPKADQPKHHDEPSSSATSTERAGDPYPLDTCPITGKKLGTMGDPILKLYDGREVRFCCPACPAKFEKDLAANLAKLDEKIIKDQLPLYPLKTSVVTGKDLPGKPYEFAYGNRLIRLGAESEKAEFLKNAKKHLAHLDKAVVDAQGKNYPIKTCPVSKEEFGGDMGKPVDMVVAGRLIRLCCKGCKKDVEKDPAKFVAMVDAASKGGMDKPDADHTHDDHKHGDK